MFTKNSKEMDKIGKWIIKVVTSCMLIYLGIRHIDTVVAAVSWILNLFQPLMLGVIMALVFNVPMCPIEKHIFCNKKWTKKYKAKRMLAILLSLLLVFSIF